MFDTTMVAGAGDKICARLDALVDELVADDVALLDHAGQLARLREVGRLADRLRAEQVRLVAVADRSGACQSDGAATAAGWLRHHTTMTAAQASQARPARPSAA